MTPEQERAAFETALSQLSAGAYLMPGWDVHRVRAALAAKQAPAGWKLVPVEPTEAMQYAGGAAIGGMPSDLEQADRAYRAMLAAAHAAPQAPAVPDGPFLVRDVAEILGVSVPDVCKVLIALGHSQRSTNMTITPDEGVAVAKWLRAAQPAPQAPLTVPHPGSEEASAMIDSELTLRNWPTNTKNAARAGYEACRKLMGAGVRAAGVKEPGNAGITGPSGSSA